MRILWLLGLTTGCGYISDAKYDLRLDPDQDGVSIEDDCDSNDPNLGLPRTFYVDADGDGFGTPDETVEACTLPENASENMLDCDDTRADVNPGMDDVFYDGVDSNCDGSNDCDADGDGFDGSAEGGLPTDECPNASDCNDADPEVKPVEGATEIFFNGEDDDCNLATGDGDADGDGFWHLNYDAIVQANGLTPLPIPEGQAGDCYDSVAEPIEGFDPESLAGGVVSPADVHPAALEVYYDGIDQNCDGLSDFDQDGDGFASADYPDREGVFGNDCLDSGSVFGVDAVDVNPDATDTWYDGVDSDCSGNNDFDQDGDGFIVSEIDCDADGVMDAECDFDQDGTPDYTGGADCDDSNASINPSADETLADGIDQNCNGFETCYADTDFDTYGAGEAESSDFSCTAVGFSDNDEDCNDEEASIYPAAQELCDGLQNDCDASELPTDEQDLDGDSYVECTFDAAIWAGDSLVVGGEDCDGTRDTVYYGALELIDGLDNDCDATLANDEIDSDGDGYIPGMFDASGWQGDSLVMGDGDCNDSEAMEYPGAAENDSTTACLLDEDGDGFAQASDYCFQMELYDVEGDGWVSGAEVEISVDGQVYGVYSNQGLAVQTESVCISGQNIEWKLIYADVSIEEVSVNISDLDGLQGSGTGLLSGSFMWDGVEYATGEVFYSVDNFGTDCDDTDNTRYPLAPELCDGVANECGVSLPADETDNDLDGYVECTFDAGGWFGDVSVVGGEDCDDADPSRSPGETEIPDDGIDNNCDGLEMATGGGTGSAQ